MMGFLDKVKKVFGSKKEDESQNRVNDEVIDEPTFTESIEDDNGNFKDNEEIQSSDLEETLANQEILDTPIINGQIRNFKYLDDLIHSGVKEVILDSNIVLGDNEESNYFGGIKLDVDDLIIDGNGFTITSNGKTRIFYCNGMNIIIKNTILMNGHSGEGGAIYNSGDLSIMGCCFKKNLSIRGGAIHNKYKMDIMESTFDENSAEEDGGAIFNIGSLNIFNSTCTSNKTGHYPSASGGAICNSGKLTIDSSRLSKNIVNGKYGLGGAIYNKGKLTIDSSRLSKNIVNCEHGLGGAVYNLNGNMNIISSTLNENTASKGGAIFNNKDYLNFSETVAHISNCEIFNNQSQIDIISNFDFLELRYNEIHDNQSKNIVTNVSKEFNFSIIECKFHHNTAENSIVHNSGKSCTIKKSIFEDNLAKNNSTLIINESHLILVNQKIKSDEKVILNEGHLLLKQSESLKSNIHGEGLVVTDEIPSEKSFDFEYLNMKIIESESLGIVLDEDITIGDYEIDYYEGGIELDIDNLVIDGNNHVIDGANISRIFIITGNNITLKNIIFKNGHSFKDLPVQSNTSGGAIKINHGLNLTIENCKFMDNTSEEHGGAIYNVGGELNILGCRLEGNSSNDNAGALYINGGAVNISESSFIGNASKSDHYLIGGGAICSIDSRMSIEESEFNENSSNREGGAICNKGGALTISKSTLSRNNSSNAKHNTGGAIYNSGTISIIESTLDENTSTNQGGAIYNCGALTISKSTLNRNSINSKNKAVDGGGAIYNFGELSIIESVLNSNISKKNGGAIYNYMMNLNIFKSTLNENICENEGGAIYSFHGKLNIVESTLMSNTANCLGIFDKSGAIDSYAEDSFNIEECTFKDNKPDDVYKYFS